MRMSKQCVPGLSSGGGRGLGTKLKHIMPDFFFPLCYSFIPDHLNKYAWLLSPLCPMDRSLDFIPDHLTHCDLLFSPLWTKSLESVQ